MRDLQYMIDVMTAARDGKRVQVRCDTRGWVDLDVNHWPWYGPDSMRIAPEPRKAREWYIHKDSNGSPQFIVFPDNYHGCGHCVLVREVLPDDQS